MLLSSLSGRDDLKCAGRSLRCCAQQWNIESIRMLQLGHGSRFQYFEFAFVSIGAGSVAEVACVPCGPISSAAISGATQSVVSGAFDPNGPRTFGSIVGNSLAGAAQSVAKAILKVPWNAVRGARR